MPAAFCIAVGSELLLPGKVESNSVALREKLFEVGIPVEGVCIVPDEETALTQCLDYAMHRCQIVIMTGGLGPTEDDITKKTVARLLKRALRYDESIMAGLEAFYRERGMKPPEQVMRQALIPAGCKILPNTNGTAPGLLAECQGAVLIMLPGPPAENLPMIDNDVLPYLKRKFRSVPAPQRRLRITGVPESQVDQTAAVLYKQYRDIQTTILASPGDVELIFTSTVPGDATGLDELQQRVATALGSAVYSFSETRLAEIVGELLVKHQMTVAVAESCTGGLLAKRLTDIPGSSAFFLGGVVSYSNPLKTALAGVPVATLNVHGAVSSQTASAMAAGILKISGASCSLAITGIAGPSGGTAEKPVGLVYIAVCVGDRSVVKKHRFFGDRDKIRVLSTQSALDMLRRMLTGLEL